MLNRVYLLGGDSNGSRSQDNSEDVELHFGGWVFLFDWWKSGREMEVVEGVGKNV